MMYLIAGAGRGVGKYLAQRLSVRGDIVFGTCNSSLPYMQRNVSLSKVDVTDESQVREWITSISYPKDIKISLINCVGINYNAKLHKSETADWMKVIDVNLKSAYLLIKHIIPIMRERQYGRIILMSSVVPIIGVSGTSAYSASKSALWGLARAASIENADNGVTVNTLNLGYFDIGMIKDVPIKYLSEITSKIPMRRLGDPKDILAAINYLVDSNYTTGSQINISGGLI